MAVQLGGDAHTAGIGCDADGAVGPAGDVSRDGGTSDDECEVGNVGMVVGRQAADGGCAGVGWRSKLGSGITRRLQSGSSDPYEVAWRCLEASWQQMACQRRRAERHEGEVEVAAMCVGAAPVRMRLWQSLKHRRRRRFRRSFEREGVQAGGRRLSLGVGVGGRKVGAAGRSMVGKTWFFWFFGFFGFLV